MPALILLVLSGLVLRGATLSRQTIANRYLALTQEQVAAQLNTLEKQGGNAVEADGDNTSKSDLAEKGQADATDSMDLAQAELRRLQVPLRRILQLGNFNERVAFIVASQLARQGRLAMAARMMRQIAPLGKDGYASAYAWLSAYQMATTQGSRADMEVLLSDLEAAENGGANLSVAQLSAFAKLLNAFGRQKDALNLLSDNAKTFPELNNLRAQLAKQMGEGGDYREAVEAGRADFVAKQKTGELSAIDLARTIQLELIDGNVDRALSVAQAGFDASPDSPEMRRLYSNVLLTKHQLVSPLAVDKAAEPVKAPDLRFLEAACQVDSANPLVVEEVAKAIALGQNLTAELRQTLEQSLLDGTASGVTHLMLANHHLVGEDPKAALPHLRLSLRQMPNSPVVLNNLAYAILKHDPDNLAEAEELVERALRIPGATEVTQASMLDTLGEIRQTRGDTLGAIESFEAALKRDNTKTNTRKKLIEAYRQVGMHDLAAAQQAFIDSKSTDETREN